MLNINNTYSKNLVKLKHFDLYFSNDLTTLQKIHILGSFIATSVELDYIETSGATFGGILNIKSILKIKNTIHLSTALLLDTILFELLEDNAVGIILNKILFNYSNTNILSGYYGFKFNYTENDSLYFVWDQGLGLFVLKDNHGNYIKIDFEYGLQTQTNSLLKTGDLMSGSLLLPIDLAPAFPQMLITKLFVDNYVLTGAGSNHDSKYVSYTGRNMDNTADITYQGRLKEVSMSGPLKLTKVPVQDMHLLNLEYVIIKNLQITNHDHNSDYLLKNINTKAPYKPLKKLWFQLGKDLETPLELLTLRQVLNQPDSHNHDYLWNETEYSNDGIKVSGTTKYKNVLDLNLLFSGTYNDIDVLLLNNNDSIIREYLDKIGKTINYGKLFFGYYDIMKGNSINEGITVAQLNLNGWYQYYIDKVNLNLLEADFLVFPIITILDLMVPNKLAQGVWSSVILNYPYTGYHGQTKLKFGNFSYPDPDKKYIINLQLSAHDISYDFDTNAYSTHELTSGYFLNIRVNLIGGPIGNTFKYYSNFSDFLSTYIKL